MNQAFRAALESMLSPEQNGWAFTPEQRDCARVLLGLAPREGLPKDVTASDIIGLSRPHAPSWTTHFELLLAVHTAVRIHGTQKAAAKSLGISPQYLADVLAGRRDISEKLAANFGVKPVRVFLAHGAMPKEEAEHA